MLLHLKRSIKLFFFLICFSLGLYLILNLPMTSKQGIDYSVRTIRTPLYIKLIGFLARDYNYSQKVKLITEGCSSDVEKVMAIFDWTRSNIRKDIPNGWPIIDDHVWNIIVRGYGRHDQSADVFSTLCTYAGFPAVMYILQSEDSKFKICISAVYFKGNWRLMDSFNGVHFRNDKGEIASIDDINTHPDLVKIAINNKSMDMDRLIWEFGTYQRSENNKGRITDTFKKDYLRSKEEVEFE